MQMCRPPEGPPRLVCPEKITIIKFVQFCSNLCVEF
nr:MAG TPA: hypothetical protein [Caudoviricetes sp.]